MRNTQKALSIAVVGRLAVKVFAFSSAPKDVFLQTRKAALVVRHAQKEATFGMGCL